MERASEELESADGEARGKDLGVGVEMDAQYGEEIVDERLGRSMSDQAQNERKEEKRVRA